MLCDFKNCCEQAKSNSTYCKIHSNNKPLHKITIVKTTHSGQQKLKINTKNTEDLLIVKKKYVIKTKRTEQYKKFINEKSKELNSKLPKSEQWFMSLYSQIKHNKDKQNKPIGGFIPDISNKKFKYIIEIDGSYHDIPEQIEKDKKKDAVFQYMGYLVIRVKAYDQNSIRNAFNLILQRRKSKSINLQIKDNLGNDFNYSYSSKHEPARNSLPLTRRPGLLSGQ